MANLILSDLTINLKNTNNYPVRNINFEISPGETLALLGESGCGKSLTSLAIMGLLPSVMSLEQKSKIIFNNIELNMLCEAERRAYRGNHIAMIFQEPMTSLNPVFTIGQQIGEVLTWHFGLRGKAKKLKLLELLDQVSINNPELRLKQYPHELSGGLKQRAMIAMALAGEPSLLIADEPTTALDVTTQKQILDLLKDLQHKNNMAMLFITHDLGIVSEIADNIAVMYAGEIIERGSKTDFFQNPLHPYSQKLLSSLPSIDNRKFELETIPGQVPRNSSELHPCPFADRCEYVFDKCYETKPDGVKINNQITHCHLYKNNKINNNQKIITKKLNVINKINSTKLINLADIKVYFNKNTIKAVDNINLNLYKGEVLALVGESGCGKTTLAKAILGLQRLTSGRVDYIGMENKKNIQLIFQDPFSAMNPRMLVNDIVSEGLLNKKNKLAKIDRNKKVDQVLELVGIPLDAKSHYPHEFSGGQRQRICIARALVLNPKVLICDEPTSALDISIQAQILNLLKNLQSELDLTYLFISHNLAVVGYLADRVAVMKAGKIIELGKAETILSQPKEAYTQQLLSSVPTVPSIKYKSPTLDQASGH